MARLVEQGYSQALFELAIEQDCLEQIQSEYLEVVEVLKLSDDLHKVLKSPMLSKEEKKALLNKVFEGLEGQYLKYFLCILIDKNRFNQIYAIYQDFKAKYNDYHNIELAYLTSARKLDDDQVLKIKQMLEKQLEKQVELICYVDEKLIAGMRLQVKDEVMDNSIFTRMRNMKQTVV